MSAMQTLRNLEELRSNLTEKLEELHRRANTATDLLSPLKYWRDPVVRFGVGVVIGLALGGGRRGDGSAGSEGLVHAVVRAGLMAAVTSLVGRTLDPSARTDETEL